MAQDQQHDFQPGYEWYQGPPFLPLEETPRTYEPFPSETDPAIDLTNTSHAPSFQDPIVPSIPTGVAAGIGNEYSVPNSVIQEANPFRNTVVSRDGYGLVHDQAEQRKEKVKDPCFRCQWKKKKCSPSKPCERCSQIKPNNHHDQSESESESWIPCFSLALESCNVFQIDLLIGSSLHSQATSHNSFQLFPDLLWTIGTPLMALGRAPFDTAIEDLHSAGPAFPELFQSPYFSSTFLDHYTFLVNPNVTKLLQDQRQSWGTIAEHRAICGALVLQCLMGKIKKIMRIKDPLEDEEVFPLFLAAVGTFLAANDTRELPYIQSHDQMARALSQLKFQLGVCIIVFGLKWSFLTPPEEGAEIDLLEDMCSSTNERMISFIRQQRLY